MKKVYLTLIVLFTTILLILFVFYNRYSNDYKQERLNEYIAKNINILNENIEFQKKYAQSLSLYVSKNNTLKEALKANNQLVALEELKHVTREIKQMANADVDIQIHTKDLKAFARSWEKNSYFGDDLSFREGLKIVQHSQKSFVSIELGKRLNIKAISPIFDKDKYIGSIEVIMGFKGIEQRIKKFALNILVLLDKKYINIAKDIKNNPQIGKYYIAQKSYNKELYNLLNRHKGILKSKKFYHKFKDKIVVLLPMKSVGIINVGKIALFMKSDSKEIVNIESTPLEDYKFSGKKREVIIK